MLLRMVKSINIEKNHVTTFNTTSNTRVRPYIYTRDNAYETFRLYIEHEGKPATCNSGPIKYGPLKCTRQNRHGQKEYKRQIAALFAAFYQDSVEGVEPGTTPRNFMIDEGLIEGKKRPRKPKTFTPKFKKFIKAQQASSAAAGSEPASLQDLTLGFLFDEAFKKIEESGFEDQQPGIAPHENNQEPGPRTNVYIQKRTLEEPEDTPLPAVA